MKNNKAHLDIDFGFLDDKDAPKTEQSKTAQAPEKRSCRHCGKKAEEDETYCTECGIKLSNAAPKSRVTAPKKVSTVYKYKWKNILLIGGGIFLFFAWIVISDSGSSSTTYTPPSTNSTYTPPAANNDYFSDGEGQTYRCSDYNYDRAMALKPKASESDALDARINAMKQEKSRIESMYVDETNQASIDRYNAAIDSFNAKNNRLKSDIAAWDQSIETYNNFLDTYCTPQ